MSQGTFMAQETNAAPPDTWSHLSSNIVKIRHKWTIDNFSFHCEKSPTKYIKSSTFWSETNDKLKWYLRAYPSGNIIANKNYFSIFLRLLKADVSDVTAQFNFYFLDVNNAMKHSKKGSYTFEPNAGKGFNRFIEKNLLLNPAAGLLRDDKLTIFCEVSVLEDIVNISGKRDSIQVQALKTQMKNDFRLLFETRRCSDITFVVGGKDIQAHRTILAARSSKFLAMFEQDMKELKINRLVIKDTDHEVFMEMLHFIYTDEAPNIEKMTNSLLAATNKYGIEALKVMCAETLYKSLKIENAIDILLLAIDHSVVQLKTRSLNFICAHTEDIMDTAVFKTKANAYPHLLVEIFRAVNSRNKRNPDDTSMAIVEKKNVLIEPG